MPNRKGVKSTVKTSSTSPAAIKRQERRAAVLEHRRQGLPYKEIAQRVGISVGLAHKDISRAMRDMLPPETVQQVTAIELARYDEMTAAYYPKALAGDMDAAEFCRKIARDRLHLVGAFPAGGRPGRSVNCNNININQPSAMRDGIAVSFITPSIKYDADGNVIGALPPPSMDGPRPIGAQEMRDEARGRYPYRIDASNPEPLYTPPPRATTPEPIIPEPRPEGPKAVKASMAERHKLEGFSEWSDFPNPSGSAFGGPFNPNGRSKGGRFI